MYFLFMCCFSKNVIMKLLEYLPHFYPELDVLIKRKHDVLHSNELLILMKFDIKSHRQDCIFMHKDFFCINGKKIN